MTDEEKKKIEELLGNLKCAKNFQCAESGFERLCSARDLGLETFLECLEEKPWGCTFAVSFGERYFCECPLRVYAAKKLKK